MAVAGIAGPAATAAENARDAAIAARDQARDYASLQFTAISTTSLTPGTGPMVFAVGAGKAFARGQYAQAVSRGLPARMAGLVDSDDSATGTLQILVDTFEDDSPRADWDISLTIPSAPAGLTRQGVATNTGCVANVAYIITVAGILLTLLTSW